MSIVHLRSFHVIFLAVVTIKNAVIGKTRKELFVLMSFTIRKRY